jgi:hypothetical protein
MIACRGSACFWVRRNFVRKSERERERERFSSEQENVKTDFCENRFLGESSRPRDDAAGVVFFLGFRVCKQQAAHERLQLMMRF